MSTRHLKMSSMIHLQELQNATHISSEGIIILVA